MNQAQPLIVNEQPSPYLRSLVDQLFLHFDHDRDGALSLQEFNALEVASGENPSTPDKIQFLCGVLGIPINPNGTMSKESYTTLVAMNVYFYPEKTKSSFRNVGLQVPDQSFPPSPPQNVVQQFELGIQQAAMQYQQAVHKEAHMDNSMHKLSMTLIGNIGGNSCQCGAAKNSYGDCPRCNGTPYCLANGSVAAFNVGRRGVFAVKIT